MKVLVTGGAGFIGSNIVKLLEQRGDQVIVFDNFSHANYKNLFGTKAEVICGDILTEGIFKKIPKVDAVIHEAAITDTTLPDDTKMVQVNFEGFKNIFAYACKNKLKLVYASSAGVYGNANSPMKESHKSCPHNIYGYSKWLCDRYLRQQSARKRPLRVVGLRYFNVYGPGETHKVKSRSVSMIYQLYQQMKANQRPRVFEYGKQRRDFVYVKDVARITVAALGVKKDAILNVGTGEARSFNEIINILNNCLNKKLAPDYFENPYKKVYQDFTQADISLLKGLKLTPEFMLEAGIKDYVENHLNASTL